MCKLFDCDVMHSKLFVTIYQEKLSFLNQIIHRSGLKVIGFGNRPGTSISLSFINVCLNLAVLCVNPAQYHSMQAMGVRGLIVIAYLGGSVCGTS